nr:unnamed protein product [Digitaria exilis]
MKGEELCKPDKRRLIPSANEHFDMTQGLHNENNRAAIKEFIAHYGDVFPGNIDMYDDEDVCKRTMDVTDGKQDARLAAKEVADVEDASDQRASDVSDDGASYEEFADCEDNPCDYVNYWRTLRRSSHRDGSIYCTKGTFRSRWQNDYRIADRDEMVSTSAK